MSWPTGDSISTGLVAVRFLVPNDAWILQSLTGSMLALLTPFSWDAVGDIDPRVAAAVFRFAYFNQQVQNLMVGQIVCFPADNMQYIGQDPLNGDSQFRKCDGAYYNKADFPELYAVIGDTFGSTSLTFAVPDLRGRAVVDAGSGSGLTPRSLGDVLGEEAHTLNTSEIPSHVHGVTPVLLLGTQVPPPLDGYGPSPFPAVTGSTGGDGAHNNMQPSLVLFYYIQVEL